MKPFKTISDPEAFQLMADETRRKIVFLLRVKDMTVSQIASELSLTPQAVYFHIRKLVKGGFVEVVREERVGHLIESFYRTTAESFNFTLGRGGVRTARNLRFALDQEKAALDALRKLGFDVKYTDQQVARLVDLMAEAYAYKGSEKLEEKIFAMDELDFVAKMALQDHVKFLSISDQEFAKMQDAQRKFRDLLISLAGGKRRRSPKSV
jgi:DNA-binding transcriptional ArsR family regulator